jgi:hypothetical protein
LRGNGVPSVLTIYAPGYQVPLLAYITGDGDFPSIDTGAPSGPSTRSATAQSSCRFGRIATCRPITAAAATMTPTATKSGGHWIRSAMSATQGASAVGNRAGLSDP